MKKLVFTIMFTLCSIASWAYDVFVDGIYYNLNTETKEASVTYKNNSYGNYAGDVVVPETVSIDGVSYTVTSIDSHTFQYCKSLKSIKLPNTVTSIGGNAFWDCENLESIVIPNSVTTIYEGTFRWCISLTSVTIPASVIRIDRGAFWYCKRLNKIINLSLTPQTISDNVFYSDIMYDDYNGEDDTNTSGIDLYVLEDCVNAYKAANVWRYMNVIGDEGLSIDGINANDNKNDNLSPRKVIDNGKVIIETINGNYTLSGQRMK